MAKKVQQKILQYILRLIGEGNTNFITKTMETFNVSRSTVYNYIDSLKESNLIEKKEKRYILKAKNYSFLYKVTAGETLEEDKIFNRDIAPILEDLKDNVQRAWRYAFTEMMNNAIEHSGAENIICLVQKDNLNTYIVIADDGIGIFKNIQDYVYKKENTMLTLDECASILLAGKFTTASDCHSGEGIFFTSHLMDSFMIMSDGVVFSRTNFSDFQNSNRAKENRTTVFMQLSNKSTKTVTKIFDLFANVDEGFFRTQIPVSHMFPYGGPVSRSEARRLGEIISKFKEVILDFSGVVEVGQAFAHELFVVWQKNFPNIELKVENANADVSKMIQRVSKN